MIPLITYGIGALATMAGASVAKDVITGYSEFEEGSWWHDTIFDNAVDSMVDILEEKGSLADLKGNVKGFLKVYVRTALDLGRGSNADGSLDDTFYNRMVNLGAPNSRTGVEPYYQALLEGIQLGEIDPQILNPKGAMKYNPELVKKEEGVIGGVAGDIRTTIKWGVYLGAGYLVYSKIVAPQIEAKYNKKMPRLKLGKHRV